MLKTLNYDYFVFNFSTRKRTKIFSLRPAFCVQMLFNEWSLPVSIVRDSNLKKNIP